MVTLVKVLFISYMAFGVGAVLGFLLGVVLYALGLLTPEALPWFAVCGGTFALAVCVIVSAS